MNKFTATFASIAATLLLAGIGQRHLARGAVEQPHAKALLQLGDVLADVGR